MQSWTVVTGGDTDENMVCNKSGLCKKRLNEYMKYVHKSTNLLYDRIVAISS